MVRRLRHEPEKQCNKIAIMLDLVLIPFPWLRSDMILTSIWACLFICKLWLSITVPTLQSYDHHNPVFSALLSSPEFLSNKMLVGFILVLQNRIASATIYTFALLSTYIFWLHLLLNISFIYMIAFFLFFEEYTCIPKCLKYGTLSDHQSSFVISILAFVLSFHSIIFLVYPSSESWMRESDWLK